MRKTVEDMAIGAGAITTPVWLQPASEWVQFFVLVGGLVLVVVRIMRAMKEPPSNGTS